MRSGLTPYILAVLVFALGACSKPPPVPDLNRFEESPVDRIVLDSELSANDYRAIFRAINRDGKLDGLKPFIEEPSDETLNGIGGVISRQIYEEALSRHGVVALTEDRVAKKSFSKFEEKAAQWKTEPGFRDEQRALRFLLAQESLASIAQHDVGFLSSDWAALAREIQKTKNEYVETQTWEGFEAATTAEVFADLKKFLASPAREELRPLLLDLKRYVFGGSVVQALFQIKAKWKTQGFEGLTRGLAAMMGTKEDKNNKLERLLKLDLSADAPTEGLFLAIGDKFIKEPDAIHEIAENFRPMASRAIAGFLREILTSKKLYSETPVFYDKAFWLAVAKRNEKNEPSAEFGELFLAIRTAVERITGPAKPELQSDDSFLHNLPIQTTAFVLTKWCEAVVLQNQTSEAWKNAPDTGFHEILLKLPVTVSEMTVNLLEPENPPKITPAQELGALGLADFAALIQQVAPTEKFGKFQYTFSEAKNQTFADALTAAVKLSDEIRPVADPGTFLKALVYPLTRPEYGHSLAFKHLESDNLMDSVNRFFAWLPSDTWQSLKRQLFEDLKFAKLSDPDFDTRRLILDFYPTEPLRGRVATLLDHFPVIEDFDKGHKGLPSAFAAYQELLKATPLLNMHAVTSVSSYVARGKFLSGTAATPEYPAIFKTMKNSKPIAEALYGLSAVTPEDQEMFVAPFWKALGKKGDGLSLHLTLLDSLVANEPKGAEALLDRFLNKGEALLDWVEELSSDERKWVMAFVESEDFPTLVTFLQKHGNRDSCLKLVRELKVLSANGYLKEAFQLLRQIRNERMQHIGKVLVKWHTSGQLLPLLNALEVFLD